MSETYDFKKDVEIETEVDVSIEVLVECAECGAELESTVQERNGTCNVTVPPCSCQKGKEEDGA